MDANTTNSSHSLNNPSEVLVPSKIGTDGAESGSIHRLAFVEGMRATAALYVVLGHVTAFVDPSGLAGVRDHSALWLQRLARFFSYGHLAVAAFIVISGFCLRWAAIHRRQMGAEPYGQFMIRRAKRILPAYYGCLALSLIIALTVTPLAGKMPYTQYLPVTWANGLAHLFLIHNLSPAWMYKINGVLWSIAIEFQIYFFFPLLAKLIGPVREKSWKSRGLLALLICGAFAALVITLIPRGMKLYPWFLGFFCLGMVGADLSLIIKTAGRWVVLGVGTLGLAVAAWFLLADGLPIWQEVGLAVWVTSLLVLGTQATGGSMTRGLFGFKPLALIGTFSYSLYLVHHPILQVVDLVGRSTWDHPIRHLGLLLVVGVPVAIGFAYLFAQLFEGKYVRRAIADLRDHP